MNDTGRTASSRAFTGKHETASMTARQPSVTAQMRAEQQKKKRSQKRTLYIVFTALAAAMIIVAAFILKGAAEQRSYNTYYSSALQDYYNGEYDSALSSLRRASAITETEECTMLMVDCYEKLGNYSKALELLEGMYKQDKTNSVVSARIADINLKISEKKNEGLVTVAGKQYEEWTSSLSLKDTALGDGVLLDVVKLYSLTTLTLSGDSLTNIAPLSALGGLTFLDLSNNSISDLRPLAELRELKMLYLDNNPITDFSPLYSLPQLEMLSIRGVAITEEQFASLAEALPKCEFHRDASDKDNTEKSVSEVTVGAISFRTDAEELDLSNLGLEDLSPLSACKGLKRLDITGNRISDLTPLMDLPALEWLSFKDNLVTDLRPLMGLGSLRYINAEGNGITTTAALAPLQNLGELYLAFNPLGDLSALPKLTNLRILGLESTGLTDEALQTLASMSSLDVLRIHDNPALSGNAVDTLKAQLRGCNIQHSGLVYIVEFGGESFREDVTEIALFGRGISNIDPVIKFKQLELLDLGANDLENIYMLQYLNAPLRELRLGNNRIEDATPLLHLRTLEVLDLTGNRISSVSVLQQLPSLRWLKLSGNPLTQEQVDELQAALPDCEIIFE